MSFPKGIKVAFLANVHLQDLYAIGKCGEDHR